MSSLTDTGIYSSESPLDQETKYTPTDKEGLMRDYLLANRVFGPMLSMLNFMQSRFQAFRYRSSRLVLLSIRFMLKSLRRQALWRFVFRTQGVLGQSWIMADSPIQHASALTRTAPALHRLRLLPLAGDETGECDRILAPFRTVQCGLWLVLRQTYVRGLLDLGTSRL